MSKYYRFTVFLALLNNWLLQEGIPEKMVCDRGTHFANALQKCNADIFNFNLSFVTAYNPRAAGLVERFNRTFRSHIRTMCQAKQADPETFPW